MGLYCLKGSILYRWRSVMSTVRFSALWKWLIWGTRSCSLGWCTQTRWQLNTHTHTHTASTLRTLQENRTLMNLSLRCSSLETSVNVDAVSGLSRFCQVIIKSIHQSPISKTRVVKQNRTCLMLIYSPDSSPPRPSAAPGLSSDPSGPPGWKPWPSPAVPPLERGL